jgi:hypothetical protein
MVSLLVNLRFPIRYFVVSFFGVFLLRFFISLSSFDLLSLLNRCFKSRSLIAIVGNRSLLSIYYGRFYVSRFFNVRLDHQIALPISSSWFLALIMYITNMQCYRENWD